MGKRAIILFLLVPFFWSCQQEPDSYRLLDQFVVATNYDTLAAFDSYKTYSLATDTIGFVSDTNPNDTIVTSPQYDLPHDVLQAIKENMDARNYTRVAADQDPDIGVNVYIVKNLNLFQQVVYPNYYYNNYYGYGGYYYYPYVQTYAYNTGSLVIEFVDLKNPGTGNRYKVIWNAYMGDVFNAVNQVQESIDAVNQAFVQSPYLGTI